MAEGAQRHRRRHPRARRQAQPVRRAVGGCADGTFRHTYVGTTDTDYDGPSTTPVHGQDDIEYVLRALNAVADDRRSRRDDVTGVWAGLRPLVKRRRAGARPTCLPAPPGHAPAPPAVVTVTGGKLTTYREMAERHRRRRWCSGSASRAGRTKRLRCSAPRATARPPATIGRCPPRRRYGSLAIEVEASSPPIPRSASRSCRACRTCGPRRCTPFATRWRRRSTTSSPAGPGPPVRPRRRRWPPRPVAELLGELGWDADEPPASSPTTARWCAGRGGRRARTAGPRHDPTDHADRAHRRPGSGPAERRPSLDRSATSWPRSPRSSTTSRSGRRRQPRLVAAGAALGARRRGAGARWRSPSADTDARYRRAAGLCRAARAADGRRGSQRRVRRQRAGVRRRAARHHRLWPASATSTPPSGRRRGPGRHVRPRPRAELQERHGLTVGHFPQSFDTRHRRRLGRLPRRRPVLDPLRQDRGPRRRPRGRARRRARSSHRRRAGRRRRPGPHPAVRRVGGHARRDHRVWLRAHPCPADDRAAYTFDSFADGIEACRRILRAARPRPCCASTTASSRPAATAVTARLRPARARRGRPGDRRGHDRVVADVCAGSAPRARSRWSTTGSSTATTRRPCKP